VLRTEIGAVAAKAAAWVGYESAGTVEFLFSNGRFYFLEVNARVQVEHPVTEMVTGVDIVKEQVQIASGSPLSTKQQDVRIHGHAIECRINAEDPFNGFAPTPGKITGYHAPGGTGIRVDSGVCSSSTVSPFYDSLIAKLIVWGRNRDEAIGRMLRALSEYVIAGVKTNIPFHRAVMENRRFAKGELGTHFIDQEVSLMEDMRRIAQSESSIQERLFHLFDDKKRVAAIAAALRVLES
jgi:pyruvate carboxylase subunit A